MFRPGSGGFGSGCSIGYLEVVHVGHGAFPERGLAGGLALNPAGVAWFVLAIVSALPLFWLGFRGLATEWARPEYSHGPVIPVLSFYMFLREMKFVPPPAQPVTDRWPGVIVIGAGLMLALLGNLVQIDDLVFYSLIVWVGGLVLVCFGFTRGIFFWPAVLHLVFMLPLPQFLYWKINTALQFLSSEIGVSFVRVMDVPVFLDGNVIDLGVYKLMVAEACSGLRYLFPIMSFSYVFAVLYTGARWHKIGAPALGGADRGPDERAPHRGDRGAGRPLRHRPGGRLPALLRGLDHLPLLHRAPLSHGAGHAAALRRPPAARRGDRPRLHRPRGPARPRRQHRAVPGADRRGAPDRGAVGGLDASPRRARRIR